MSVLGLLTTGSDVLTVSDRDRILQAMADCCARSGYPETTVKDVLERAGVERESFTIHFSGKEDCALAALNKMVSESLARLSMASSKSEEALERRKFEGQAFLELLASRPSFANLAFIESRQCGSKRMHDAYESAARVLALMMERLGADGSGPSADSRAALGAAEAVIRRELATGRAARLPELLPDFVYAVLVPFVGQREALRQARLAARMAAEEE